MRPWIDFIYARYMHATLGIQEYTYIQYATGATIHVVGVAALATSLRVSSVLAAASAFVSAARKTGVRS